MTAPNPDTKATQIGTFVKTASPHIVEIIGSTTMNFVVLDAEHAPMDRATLDIMVMASRAANIKAYIRIAEVNAAVILSALDIGAAGIVVPHVDSARQALDVVAMARYKNGLRGFSISPRANSYGSISMKDAMRLGDATEVICQIESAQAVEECAEILATPGVAGIFIGRADLALSMGYENSRDENVLEATKKCLALAAKAGKLAGMHVSGVQERDQFAALGANWFVIGSDQSLLKQAAQAVSHAA